MLVGRTLSGGKGSHDGAIADGCRQKDNAPSEEGACAVRLVDGLRCHRQESVSGRPLGGLESPLTGDSKNVTGGTGTGEIHPLGDCLAFVLGVEAEQLMVERGEALVFSGGE